MPVTYQVVEEVDREEGLRKNGSGERKGENVTKTVVRGPGSSEYVEVDGTAEILEKIDGKELMQKLIEYGK